MRVKNGHLQGQGLEYSMYSGVPNKRTGTLINFQKNYTLVRSY